MIQNSEKKTRVSSDVGAFIDPIPGTVEPVRLNRNQHQILGPRIRRFSSNIQNIMILRTFIDWLSKKFESAFRFLKPWNLELMMLVCCVLLLDWFEKIKRNTQQAARWKITERPKTRPHPWSSDCRMKLKMFLRILELFLLTIFNVISFGVSPMI